MHMPNGNGGISSAANGDGTRFRPLGRAWRERVPQSRLESTADGSSRIESARNEGMGDEGQLDDHTASEENEMSQDTTTETERAREEEGGDWSSVDQGGDREPPRVDEFGEDAELRRAMELLAELIELEPEKLSLYRRRAEYARRLEDEEELMASYLSWAEVLEGRGSWRSAHLLYQQARALRPESERVREALERLEAEQGAALGVSLPRGATWGEAWRDRAEAESGPASLIWPELRRALEEVNWLQAAALRTLPGREAGPADREEAEREAAEILGRYFVTRGEYERAAEVLATVVDREDVDDGDRLDALYLKGLAHLRMEEGERADSYFRRVAQEDEEFRTVAEWFGPELEEAGA